MSEYCKGKLTKRNLVLESWALGFNLVDFSRANFRVNEGTVPMIC